MSLLTDLLDAQLAILKSDLKTDLVPVAQQVNNMIAANPTVANVLAQGGKLLVDLIAEGPKVGQDELKGLAEWLNTKLQEFAAPTAPPAPPAASSAPAAAAQAPGVSSAISH